MPDPVIRPRNAAMLFKLEANEGVDAAPTAADAFPFETGYSYTAPYRAEGSNEVTGSLVASAPLILGQPVTITIPVRIKGAGTGTTYSASVKPPHHALLAACGKRGLFTAAVSAAAITAGTESTVTLPTGFTATAQLYRGMPLQLSGGNSNGRLVHISDYTSGRVATLTDQFGTALTTSVQAAMPANWTYSGTSPKGSAARATDHPSGTLYLYEDGTLMKFFGCRGRWSRFGGQTAQAGFWTFELTGIYGGKTDATMPAVSVPLHSAPVLAQMGGNNPTVLVNRKEMPIGQWELNEQQQTESPADPNTTWGFRGADIDAREPRLQIDPLATLAANRDINADVVATAAYPSVLRLGTVAGNRWSLVNPMVQPVEATPGERGIYRSEQISLAALNPGVDPSDRDAESVICFY